MKFNPTEVAIIINNEIKDLQVGYINVTEVRVTRDHSLQLFTTRFYLMTKKY